MVCLIDFVVMLDTEAASIHDIWKFLEQNLAENYSPPENITVSELLFEYRGKVATDKE